MTLDILGTETPLTWPEFELQANELINDSRKSLKAWHDNPESGPYSTWIFRGHGDASWKLETTLERYLQKECSYTKDDYPVFSYYRRLSSIVPAINTHTKYTFEKFQANALNYEEIISSLPYNELLCFARHLGFPSPLLDWTESYYVAAYFAYRDAMRGRNVAIYAYQEWIGEARGGWAGDPMIHQQSSNLETHNRHYRQQSNYTACFGESQNDKLVFMKHEAALLQKPNDHTMKKFILCSEEKKKVLDRLFMMNVNDFTLFGGEESLMRMLAYKSFAEL